MAGCGKPCDCESYRAHLLSISVAPSAMPSRSPDAVATQARADRWDRDIPAYKRLRRNGLQPPRIDGCADLESRAREPVEVETGRVAFNPRKLQQLHDERT